MNSVNPSIIHRNRSIQCCISFSGINSSNDTSYRTMVDYSVNHGITKKKIDVIATSTSAAVRAIADITSMY